MLYANSDEADKAALSYRWYRFTSRLRCLLGIHRLVGHRDCGDGVNVAPYNPHAAKPGQGAWRVCSWCGARWVAAYDGISPFWQRRS